MNARREFEKWVEGRRLLEGIVSEWS